jgi:hypothetical protein
MSKAHDALKAPFHSESKEAVSKGSASFLLSCSDAEVFGAKEFPTRRAKPSRRQDIRPEQTDTEALFNSSPDD